MAHGEEGIGYWTRWQVPVCALIAAVPGAVAVVLISRARPDPVRPTDLWVPCWRNLHPLWLLSYRLFVSVVMSLMLVEEVVLRGGVTTFFFYTQWTFALVIIYFVIGTLISARGCWILSKELDSGNDEAHGIPERDPEENIALTFPSGTDEKCLASKLLDYPKEEQNKRTARLWSYMMQLMQIAYQTSAGAVILTDVVYWCLLAPFSTSKSFRVSLITGCMHSLNITFLLLDTALNRLPFPSFRMAYFVLWTCSYMVFQWVLHACGISWWPYFFLDLATPWAPLWYLCVALVHVPCYGFYFLIVKGKDALLPKIFSHVFISTYRHL